MISTIQKLGGDLKIGDVIETWWPPKQNQIVALVPYRGPLQYLFPQGAQLAAFAVGPVGMTINNAESYNVLRLRRSK
jgi:hypothetical protein